MNDSVNLIGLSRHIVEAGLLDEKKILEAMQQAKYNQTHLVTWLIQNKLVNSRVLMKLAAEQFCLPYLDLRAVDAGTFAHDVVSEKIARKHRALPLYQRGKKLFVAVSDPGNQSAINDIQFSTGLLVELLLVEDGPLGKAIDALYQSATGGLEGIDDAELDNIDLQSAGPRDIASNAEVDETPVVRFVHKMLLDAIKNGSSDLHFEPYEHLYRVRFRTDGVLYQVSAPPLQLRDRITARLKIMAEMDISERRRPQDGRIKLNVSANKAIDFRVSTLPTIWGEKVVMRILDSSSAKMGIDALGYEEDQKELYLEALKKPQGMILVTGPTGSGKTVSMYTGLNILNTIDVNISTAEDPVEINLEGVNQVGINAKQGMDFSTALRAFLRQDPDIIMVGEIRDLETAEIAVKAAQTGHLVMSTLHTNSAAETLMRLRNMGVASFNVATSVHLIIAQRLARRLCKCKEIVEVPDEALLGEGFTPEQLGTFKVYGPKGCDNCNGGYKGRVGVYEVVKSTQALQRLVMADGNAIEIEEQMRKDGFKSLRASGLLKVVQGVTSLAEINRVTKD